MAFSDAQKTELTKPLDPKHIAKRDQSGRKLSYVEGWHVIAEANRIFGFDGWQRETIEMREVRPPELVKSERGKETWRVGFIAKVRVTVGDTVREGTGYGSGALPDLGEAYESAVKEAETDAMKRALMTFGNPFGLALYDKEQANVAKPEKANSHAPMAPPTGDDFLDDGPTESEKRLAKQLADEIAKLGSLKEMDTWRKKPEAVEAFRDLPPAMRRGLQETLTQRRSVLANLLPAG